MKRSWMSGISTSVSTDAQRSIWDPAHLSDERSALLLLLPNASTTHTFSVCSEVILKFRDLISKLEKDVEAVVKLEKEERELAASEAKVALSA